MDTSYRHYAIRQEHKIDDELLERALEGLEGGALQFSSGFITNARLRDNYRRNVVRVKGQVLEQVKTGKVSAHDAAEFCYEARNKIMVETRHKTSVPGGAIAEKRKIVSPALERLLNEKASKQFGKTFVALSVEQRNALYYEIVEAFARPNTEFNTLNNALKVAGKVLVVVTITYATYGVVNAENKQKVATQSGVASGGGVAGPALARVPVAKVCGPGAPFCSIGLMLAGGVTSGWASSKVADSFEAEIEEFTQWKIG